jgi:hypothetical protein
VFADSLVTASTYVLPVADDDIYEPVVPSSDDDNEELNCEMPSASRNECIRPVQPDGCSVQPDVEITGSTTVDDRCAGVGAKAKQIQEELDGPGKLTTSQNNSFFIFESLKAALCDQKKYICRYRVTTYQQRTCGVS